MQIIKPNLDAIPDELKTRPQWVVWRRQVRDGKPTKVPKQTNGKSASSTNPDTWTSFENVACAINRFDGIGYMFSKDDPYTGVDLDKICTDGEPSPWFDYLVHMFGSYAEYSVSGTGLHIICKGVIPGGKGRKKDPYEMYSSGRYFTFTGHVYQDFTTITEAQRQIEALYGHAFR